MVAIRKMDMDLFIFPQYILCKWYLFGFLYLKRNALQILHHSSNAP